MKKGFTIAEVLIVLGIIGVVAAMTLSNLITNYQKKEAVVQLKKAYSELSQGFSSLILEEGINDFGETTLIQSINGDTLKGSEQKKFTIELKKIFNISKVYDNGTYPYNTNYKYLGDNSSLWNIFNADLDYVFILNDGKIEYLKMYKNPIKSSYTDSEIIEAGGKMFKTYGSVWIDVNGAKAPNKIGRDLFQYIIAQNGMPYPGNGRDHSIYATGKDWRVQNYYWRSNNKAQCNPENMSYAGFGCAGRIMEENWEMNY